jgi:hypothetical protein
MTYPLDHNQQYFAYLQAWRQLLEPLLTMAPAMPYPPGTPWGMPPMPPYPPAAPLMPPTAPAAPLSPPMPTDYAQQLFGQLQTWRQYLEQMTGARPGPAQPSGSSPVEGGPAREGRQPGRSTVPVEPDDPNAGKIWDDSTAASNSSSERSWPPPKVDVRPINELGNQDPLHTRHPIRPDNEGGSIHVDPGLFNQAALARGQQIGTPPPSEGAKYGPVRYSRNPSSATMPLARLAAASPVSAATRQVSSSAQIQAPQSRFKGLAERANALGGG